MAGERKLKGRIKSARNISQITKAMQMVAASRMRKAQDQAVSGKPYQEKIYETVAELAEGIDPSLHSLLQTGNPRGKVLNIIISSNKGLCGGLNTNLFRAVNHWFPKTSDTIDYITMGRKAEYFILRSRRNLTANFTNDNYLDNVAPVTALFTEGFLKGEYKEVNIIFSEFVNSLKQEPAKRTILPISSLKVEADQEKAEEEKDKLKAEFTIEPSSFAVLNSLLPHYLEIQVRNAILEAYASEHSARMIAMKNATDNASSLISDLTLEYNQLRQQKITYEIADIVTARLGVEG